jgi:hypothetical protein
MKTLVALLILFLAAVASAQTVPTVQQQLQIQQMMNLLVGSGTTTVLPSSPNSGMVINSAGRMTPYTVAPSPGLQMRMNSRGAISMSYDFGNGMVMDLD